jgi:pimeloyl-ACP methyl ester carboxylesterase
MPNLTANGIQIEYEIAGRAGGPAILLAMGLGVSLIGWPDSLFLGLADQGYRVIRYDNRDVGRSTRLAELVMPDIPGLLAKLAAGEPVTPPYKLDDMAMDVAALLDGLGIAKAHVVGVSMGGMIGQLLALNHPEKVKSLVSIMSTTGKAGLPPSNPQAMTVVMSPPKSFAREDRIAALMDMHRVIAGPEFASPEEVWRAAAERSVEYAPVDPVARARQMAAVMTAPARNARLAGLKIPTLVVHGTLDPIFPLPHGEDTAASIPGARLKVVPGFGHSVIGPAEPVVREAIAAWVAEVEARG